MNAEIGRVREKTGGEKHDSEADGAGRGGGGLPFSRFFRGDLRSSALIIISPFKPALVTPVHSGPISCSATVGQASGRGPRERGSRLRRPRSPCGRTGTPGGRGSKRRRGSSRPGRPGS